MLSPERQSARIQKIIKGRLDQYGAERFGRLIFATIRKSVGLKGLNTDHNIAVFRSGCSKQDSCLFFMLTVHSKLEELSC